jgi:hypothetical protein
MIEAFGSFNGAGGGWESEGFSTSLKGLSEEKMDWKIARTGA